MIAPALTSWPAKIFTPRRLLWESRPFFEEPRPFLCAMSVALRGRGLERRESALALGVALLVLERGRALGRGPARHGLLDLGDREVGVAVRHAARRLLLGRALRLGLVLRRRRLLRGPLGGRA